MSLSPQHDYSRRWLSAVLRRPVRESEFSAELLDTVFHHLSREEECSPDARDLQDDWIWVKTHTTERSWDRPVVDDLLRHECRDRGETWNSKERWPNDAPFALCLSHDVDILHKYNRSFRAAAECGKRVLRGVDRARVGARFGKMMAEALLVPWTRWKDDDPVWRMEKWIDVETRFGFYASYFFIPFSLRKTHFYDMTYQCADQLRYRNTWTTVRGMMRDIAEAGFDVGLHGSYFSYNDPSMLRDQKQQIEDCVGRPVTTTRQHYLRYHAAQTPRIHAEAGLECDSTQGFDVRQGFRAGTVFPYWCWDHQANRRLPVLEVPMHIEDVSLFEPGYQNLSLDNGLQRVFSLMDTVQDLGGCLTLNWHPNRLEDERYFESYRLILEEAARRGAWGCSVKMLHDRWLALSPPDDSATPS